MNPLYQQFIASQAVPNPVYQMNNLQMAISKARQIMQGIRDPRQFVLQSFGNIPPEIQNDPDQILQYLRQNNLLSNQQMQALRMLKQ